MRSNIKRAVAAVLAIVMAAAMPGIAWAEDEMTFEETLQASYDVVPETNNIGGWPQGPLVYGN